MIVCHCSLVTDAALRELVAAGRLDIDDVTARCGAAADCGGCRDGVEALLEELTAAATSPTRLTPV